MANSSSTHKKYFPKLGFETITIIVGTGDRLQKFGVHEALVTSRSPFFKNALQGDWVEAQQHVVKLPYDTPEVFALYIQGLYTGHLESEGENSIEHAYSMLSGLYILAERLRDIQTKSMVLEEIKTQVKVDTHLSAYLAMVTEIYEGTPGACGIRRLLVDLFAKSRSQPAAAEGLETFTSKLDGVPQQFLMDLVYGLYTKRKIDWHAFTSEYYAEENAKVRAPKQGGCVPSVWGATPRV